MSQQASAQFPVSSLVDFVVIGSGAAGGIIAKELATRGLSVVVLEQGPRLAQTQFEHDEFKNFFQSGMTNTAPITWRPNATERAQVGAGSLMYAKVVGGSSVHFTANFWRLRPIDFTEASKLGTIAGTGLADWPITYEDLEPYYTKVDWEIGVSGAPGWGDPPRSRAYPMPPLPNKSSGVIFERAAKQLGWHPEPAPLAINSQPHNGRPACQHCGYCMGFGCEYGAKNSTLATVIPIAEKTGKCEVRANSYVRKIETDAKGRVTGVVYFDADRREQRQRARAVVLCANGAETPRLLLNSRTNQFPQGLANSSGLVGKYLMFNGAALAQGIFEHPLNEYKSTNVRRYALDWYDSDPKRGFYGGGGIDARFDGKFPIIFALSTPPHHPNWGPVFKRYLQHGFTRQMALYGHSTSLPVETNDITLDPKVKDDFGVPALRVTYTDHPDDLKMSAFLLARCKELLEAAKARQYWGAPVTPQTFSAHLLGTCRMGNDPSRSVVDKFHRAHDVPNLFVCDGSSLVTSGRGQPTMTIMALAFRAGEKIAEFAKRGEM